MTTKLDGYEGPEDGYLHQMGYCTRDHSQDALDHATSIENESELTTYWLCPGCDFPHKSEQQAINCCTPTQIFECPQCFSFRYSEYEARECCR